MYNSNMNRCRKYNLSKARVIEGGIDKNNKWFKKVSHIPYKYLRKSWQKLFLDIIKKKNASKMNFKEKLSKNI